MTSTILDRTVGEEPGTYLLTRSGTSLRGRPVTLADGPRLAEFFARRRLRCIESSAHHEALEVERALGFHVRAAEGEPGLMVVEADLA